MRIYAVIPKVAVAGGDGHSGVGAMVDNKGQRVSTGAAIGVGKIGRAHV